MGLQPKENGQRTTRPGLLGAEKGQLTLCGNPGVLEFTCVDPDVSSSVKEVTSMPCEMAWPGG